MFGSPKMTQKIRHRDEHRDTDLFRR